MNKLEKLAVSVYKEDVKNILSKEIKGYIHVSIICDVLVVDVHSCGFDFHYTEYNITSRIFGGIKPRTTALNCIRQYRKEIFSLFFRE